MSTAAGRRRAWVGRLSDSSPDRAPDRSERALDVPLNEAKEREARLGRPPELVRLAERLLGLGQLAESEPDLAELVEGRAGDAGVPEAKVLAGASASSCASLSRPLNFITSAWFTRHIPGKAEAVFASQKSHGAVGPLARALEVGDVAARADRVAVHRERRERIELAGEGGRARLVEQKLALGDLALRDQGVPLTLQAADLEVAIAEAPPQLLGLPRESERLAEVAGVELVEALLQGPVAVLGPFLLEVEQTLGAAHPAVRQRRLQVVPLIVRDPRGDEGSPQRVARLEVAAVRTLEVRPYRVHVAVPHRCLRRGA